MSTPIRDYCAGNDVVAVAIDAQLTFSLDHENDFRFQFTCNRLNHRLLLLHHCLLATVPQYDARFCKSRRPICDGSSAFERSQ
jgi:hypothetical protein